MPDLDDLRLFDPSLPDVDRDVAPIRHDARTTSRAAGERALPRSGSRRRTIVEHVARVASTAEEVGTRYGWAHQTYSAAVSTLARDGWLVDSGERRTTSTGADAIVWEISRAGRDALAREVTT